MRSLRFLTLAVVLCCAASTPLFAASGPVTSAHLAGVSGMHAQVVVATPGISVGWYNGRYYDGQRYWDRQAWYAAHPGWAYGWGPGWRYHPGVVVGGPGIAVGWYGGRYYDGHRYWARRDWYAAHPGWRGGWGPGWHYRP
jgi:hypothetical protein